LCSQSSLEKASKQFDNQLLEVNTKLGELQKEVNDLTVQRNRSQSANLELQRRLEDSENQVNQLLRIRQALTQQLEEVKVTLEDEVQLKTKLGTDNRNLQVRVC